MLLIAVEGITDGATFLEVFSTNLDYIFAGNSVGQIIALIGIAVFSGKLVFGNEWKTALRFNTGGPDSLKFSLLAALIMVTVQPLVIWLGWVNLQFPLPESYMEFERAQNLMLENYLRSNHFLPLTLLHVALIPAVCEEVFMRGMLLRILEKSGGVIFGLVASSIIFGLFHVRLTQVIPLAVLGFVLAWSTLKSGSILPAAIAHFVNNGANVVLSRYYPEFIFEEFTPEHPPEILLSLISLAVTAALLFYMHQLSRRKNVLST